MFSLFVLLLAPALDGEWTGSFVYSRKPNQAMREGGDVVGTFSFSALVVKEDGDRLRVRIYERRGGVETCFVASPALGWVEKTDVVLDKDADQYFTDLLKVDAGNSWAYIARGLLRVDRGYANSRPEEYEAAIKDLDKAVALNAKSPMAFMIRARAWHNKGKYDFAIADLSEAIRLDPNLEGHRKDYALGRVCTDGDHSLSVSGHVGTRTRDRSVAGVSGERSKENARRR